MRQRKQLLWPPWWTAGGYYAALSKCACGGKYRIVRVKEVCGMPLTTGKNGRQRYLYFTGRKNDKGIFETVSVHNNFWGARVAMEYLAGEEEAGQ